METREVIYKWELEVDKLDSQDFPDLELPTKLFILNKVILMYVKACYGLNNQYRQGFEEIQLRVDQLQVLIDKTQSNISFTTNSSESNSFVASLSTVIDDYLHLVRSFTLADKASCTNRKLFNKVVRHGELNEILANPDRIGSFEFQELPIVLASNKIFAYTDGTFTPKTIHLEFLKYPIKIDMVGYIHLDGTASADVNSELPDSVLEDIISLSAKFARGILSDTQQYQVLDKISKEQE